MKPWRAKAGPPSAAEGRYGATAPELVEEQQTSVGEPELADEFAEARIPAFG